MENQTPIPKKRTFWKVLLIIVLIGLAIVLVLVGKKYGWQSKIPTFSIGKPDPYQAVFLINSQVYFGKLKSVRGDEVVLDDVYYLQVNQQIQPGPEGKNQPEINLVKMGKEIHGPVDKMVIPKSSIIFWEDIRSDGEVAKTIAEHKKQN